MKVIKSILRAVLTAIILFILIIVADFFGIVNADNAEAPSSRPKVCADFRTWQEAQQDFLNGNTRLDRNHDLIACNVLHDIGK